MHLTLGVHSKILMTVTLISAQSIWEIGCKNTNPVEFKAALDESELQEFGFTDAFAFDLWGAVTDAKQGRLKAQEKKAQEFEEQF